MARQRVVKAYGKRGVRKIDVSDEWKQCLQESPIGKREAKSTLLISHRAQPTPLKDNTSILNQLTSESSYSFSSSDSSGGVTLSARKQAQEVCQHESPNSSSSRKALSLGFDSENPLPRPCTGHFDSCDKEVELLASSGHERSSPLLRKTGHRDAPQRQNTSRTSIGCESGASRASIGCENGASRTSIGNESGASRTSIGNESSSSRTSIGNGCGTSRGSIGSDSYRTRASLVSSASRSRLSVVLDRLSPSSLTSREGTPSEATGKRTDSRGRGRGRIQEKENRQSPLAVLVDPPHSPCLAGLVSPEDKAFLHDDSLEIAFHQLRLTPPDVSSTPKERKQPVSTVSSPERYVSPLLEYLSPVRKCSEAVSDQRRIFSICGQTELEPVSHTFASGSGDVVKLGEGVYGEVFSLRRPNLGTVATKVVPVGGSAEVNGEKQKTLEEMLPEMVITKELSVLRSTEANSTCNFIQLHKMAYGVGEYPPPLLRAWHSWNAQHSSENDCPDMFSEDQCYILFETEHGGVDLEHFKITKTAEAVSVFWQVCGTLAVAEKELEFEHRDLHWGNVLVRRSPAPAHAFTVEGRQHQVASEGLRAVVIDYTLSRLKKEECVSYNDLSSIDWLFEGQGDYQFDVYRLMREETKSRWMDFHPRTNVLWLHYLALKLCSKLKKVGRDLIAVRDRALGFRSALDLFASRSAASS